MRPRFTGRGDYALGMFALFLLGVIGAAAGLGERLRRAVPNLSHKAAAAPIDRCEIR